MVEKIKLKVTTKKDKNGFTNYESSKDEDAHDGSALQDPFTSQLENNSLDDFWKNFDSEGYSLWYIEYNNDPNECVTLLRTCIIKGDILEQLKYFKKYCFGVLGAYGGNGDYKIKGCMLWRGNDIPEEIKLIHCYKKMSFKKLDCKEQKDRELVNDYWTKIGEKEKVGDLPAIDARYFF